MKEEFKWEKNSWVAIRKKFFFLLKFKFKRDSLKCKSPNPYSDWTLKQRLINTNKFQINVLSHSRGIPLPRYTRHIIEFENHATTPLIIHLKRAYMKTWQLREVKNIPWAKRPNSTLACLVYIGAWILPKEP